MGDDIIAVSPVLATFEAVGIPHHVGGSIASSLHGVARTTLDVDLVADVDPEHAEDLGGRLEAEFHADPDRIRSCTRAKRAFNLIHLGTMYKIDVVPMLPTPFERSARSRVVRLRLEPDDPGSPVALVSAPEDIVLHKLVWFRDGNELADRQWRDVVGVLEVQSQRLDETYLDHWATELGVGDLLERARRDAAGG